MKKWLKKLTKIVKKKVLAAVYPIRDKKDVDVRTYGRIGRMDVNIEANVASALSRYERDWKNHHYHTRTVANNVYMPRSW